MLGRRTQRAFSCHPSKHDATTKLRFGGLFNPLAVAEKLPLQTCERKQFAAWMAFALESVAQQFGADQAVSHAVAAVSHREMHERSVLFMWIEEQQPIAGFGEGSGPGEDGSKRKIREQFGVLPLRPSDNRVKRLRRRSVDPWADNASIKQSLPVAR